MLLMAVQLALILYKFLIHAVKVPALMKWSRRTIINKAWSWRGVVFQGAPLDLPVTKVPVAACLRRMWLMVARVRPIRPAIALCHMPSRARVCKRSCHRYISCQFQSTGKTKKFDRCWFYCLKWGFNNPFSKSVEGHCSSDISSEEWSRAWKFLLKLLLLIWKFLAHIGNTKFIKTTKKRQGVPNRWQLDRIFNSLSTLTSQEAPH